MQVSFRFRVFYAVLQTLTDILRSKIESCDAYFSFIIQVTRLLPQDPSKIKTILEFRFSITFLKNFFATLIIITLGRHEINNVLEVRPCQLFVVYYF